MTTILGNNKVQCKCPKCHTEHTFTLTDDEFTKYLYYLSGGDIFIQHVFPKRSASDRELLRGSICGKCWDKMFPSEDYE